MPVNLRRCVRIIIRVIILLFLCKCLRRLTGITGVTGNTDEVNGTDCLSIVALVNRWDILGSKGIGTGLSPDVSCTSVFTSLEAQL